MMSALPNAIRDPARLNRLRRLDLLDTPAEAAFDRLTGLAARLLDVPVALVSLVDEDRQFFKSCLGLPEPWVSRRETPLSHSFCQHAVASRRPLVIEDTRHDPLGRGNLAIRDLAVVAYAGIPLLTDDGYALGTLCAIDHKPRAWAEAQLATLTDLAASVMTEIELRAAARAAQDEAAARRQAEAALRVSQQRLSLAVEAARLGTWELDVRTGEIACSAICRSNFGLAPDAPFSYDALVAMLHPDDRDRMRAAVQRSLARQERYEMDYRVVWPDGSVHWVAASGRVVADDGSPVRMVGVTQEVTDRHRAGERLRLLVEASSRLAASVDDEAILAAVAQLTVPGFADWCVVHMMDGEGLLRRSTVAHADPEKAHLAAALDERYPPLPEATTGPAHVARTGRAALVPEVSDERLAALTQDAGHLALLRTLGFRSSVSAPLWARDRLLGVLTLVSAEIGRRYGPADLAFAEDLARRAAIAIDNARLYRQTQEAVRARDEFLSIAAHELRTPVAGIKGHAQLLRRTLDRGAPDADRLARYARTIDEATDRLTVLTDDLLDVARLRLGRLPLRPRTLDLDAVVQEAAAHHADGLGDRYHLAVDVATDLCPVLAEPDRLGQVLDNLLDNAVKYSPAGGEIRLAVAGADGGVLLTVQDEGIGLPPDAVETIFEPFGRAPSAIGRGLPGMGLGLSICRGIVERHGGRIWAESAGEDRGTTISVWLPCSLDDPTPPTASR